MIKILLIENNIAILNPIYINNEKLFVFESFFNKYITVMISAESYYLLFKLKFIKYLFVFLTRQHAQVT